MTTRALQPEDLFAIAIITDSQISPDGSQIAYSVKRARPDENDYSSAIWLAATDGKSEPRQITAGSHRDTSPRWSPDGQQLAYLSDRSGATQIYVIDLGGGEPRQVTDLERGVNSLVWSPNGNQIAFTSSQGYGVDDDVRARKGGFIRHLTRLDYRFDVAGYLDERFQHVWIVDVEGGTPRQISAGEQNDLSPSWSPDGSRIAFVSNREGQENPTFRSQLYVIDASAAPTDDGDGALKVSDGTRAVHEPRWSPGGDSIACVGMREGAPAGGNADIYLLDPSGDNPAKPLTSDWDRSPGTATYSDTWGNGDPATLFWSDAGDALYCTANDQGRVSLFRVTLDGAVKPIINGDRTIAFTSASESAGLLAYVAGDFTNPCDLYVSALDGSDERRLTALNDDFLSGVAIQQPEHLPFESFDGRFTVDAWLIRPVGYDESENCPLVQIIHGGPHSIFGHVFFFDMQLWASQGWNVLFVNPRATQGYGEEFATCNLGDWGGADWKEQEQALDLAITQGGIDPDRLAVTGLSYGGFMTNWIIGHSNRYTVAVSENSLSNLVSFYTTSDIGWYWLEPEMGPEVWSNLDFYMERSPISYVEQIETPTLLLQAVTDYRCPIEQGEQFYRALLARGVPTEMLRFPGESHGFLRTGTPENRLERRKHTLRWFNEYL